MIPKRIDKFGFFTGFSIPHVGSFLDAHLEKRQAAHRSLPKGFKGGRRGDC